MDGIKIAVSKFEQYIKHTENDIWFGILKREYATKKYTVSEWHQIIESLKNRPANM